MTHSQAANDKPLHKFLERPVSSLTLKRRRDGPRYTIAYLVNIAGNIGPGKVHYTKEQSNCNRRKLYGMATSLSSAARSIAINVYKTGRYLANDGCRGLIKPGQAFIEYAEVRLHCFKVKEWNGDVRQHCIFIQPKHQIRRLIVDKNTLLRLADKYYLDARSFGPVFAQVGLNGNHPNLLVREQLECKLEPWPTPFSEPAKDHDAKKKAHKKREKTVSQMSGSQKIIQMRIQRGRAC